MDGVTDSDLTILLPILVALVLAVAALSKPPKWLRSAWEKLAAEHPRYGRPLDVGMFIVCVSAAAISLWQGDRSAKMYAAFGVVWAVRMFESWRMRHRRTGA